MDFNNTQSTRALATLLLAGLRAMPVCVAVLIAGVMVLPTSPLFAQQTATGVPNALQGFSKNRNQPVKISADRLEVRDKDQRATFSGSVRVVQGDTTMRCKSLVVFYENSKAAKAKGPKTDIGERGQQSIRRLEAKGGVVVTHQDQTATGDNGFFDMKANTVTLVGNVVIARERDVLRGQRLVVDLNTGVSRVDAGKGGQGRVEALIQPNAKEAKDGKAKGKPAGARQRNRTRAPAKN